MDKTQTLTGEAAARAMSGALWRGFMGWPVEKCRQAYVRRYDQEPEHILVSGVIMLAGPIPKAVTDEKRQDSI